MKLDGSHQSDEDFTYFHLPPVKDRKDASATLFGISCNRQILTKDLVVKTSDITRSSVQKAVVVLATQPIFGVLRQRLAVVTATWFDQKDFTQTTILREFYDSLNATIPASIPDSAFLMGKKASSSLVIRTTLFGVSNIDRGSNTSTINIVGTSLRELVKKFKYKVLVLLKLLLLEKRVIFYGYPVETLCTYQYSLISLIPGLLKNLQDTGSPLLDSQELYMQSMSKTPSHSTDKQALFKYLGLPLHIFGEGSFFQPYLPLQQIDILQNPWTRSYIIGTTNSIFLHNRDIATDVIVNTEPGTIDFVQDSLSSVLNLTYADRRWMDEIIDEVNKAESGAAQTKYEGSDDYLRAKFEEYILTLLSSVKHSQFTPSDDTTENIGNSTVDKSLTADYGMYFVKAWQQTPNFQLWNDYVDWELLNEIVAPGHPCQGNFSLAHVQRRLANQFKDMGIDKNFQPLKQSFSRAMTTSKERLSSVFDTMWQEFEKLQPEEGEGTGAVASGTGQSFEPSIYTIRAGKPTEGKGIRNSISSNRIRRTNSRSDPDPELTTEDDMHDAIVPPPGTIKTSPRSNSDRSLVSGGAGGNGDDKGDSKEARPRSSSAAGSPVSALGSTMGPATAATAALGQKAAGMFSNVSSFFQAKKKEFLDVQREAEEQYQQRIHEHERKQRLMQERARATASTFAISPKQALKFGGGGGSAAASANASASSSPGPDSRAPGRISTASSPTMGLYSYVAPKSPPSRSPATPRKSPPPAASTPTIAAVATQMVAKEAETTGSVPEPEKGSEAVNSTPASLEIVSPIPTAPMLLSPTLTRGGSSSGGGGEQTVQQGGTVVDLQSQKEIEKELLEALESSNEISKPNRVASSGPAAVPPSSLIAPPRQLTPGESYSPFTEISAPSSPVKPEAEAKESNVEAALAANETEVKAEVAPVPAPDTEEVSADKSSPPPTASETTLQAAETKDPTEESQSKSEEDLQAK
ncbi:late secretory pathway protein avl9 [Mortierella sp. GBA43]|nr:late secretory pathway protein avl9 [Mortierella sp. GBA43]